MCISGLVPRKMRELSAKYNIEVPKSTFLVPEKQQNVRGLLKDYFVSLSKHLVKDHLEMQNFEKQNMRILQTKGELTQERKEKLEAMQSAYEKLLSNTQNFSEILDEDMPVLKGQTLPKNEEVCVENVLLAVENTSSKYRWRVAVIFSLLFADISR